MVGDSYQNIISDHLGTPLAMFDEQGNNTWSMELDIYGQVKNVKGRKEDCPFRYPGQYEDSETGLYYNRFRYYDPEVGGYVSQDPIGLLGGGLNVHAYVHDLNSWVDKLGLLASSWNQFQAQTKGWFGSRSEAATGWTVYKESATSKEMLAIGRLADTEAAEKIGMRRLNTNGWTPAVNDAWVQGGIDAKKDFYLASPPIKANRVNPPGSRFPNTVFDRELKQLDMAGYSKKGKKMIATACTK